MDPVPLDPGRYSGTYKLVAGRASLDFVNTVSWPGTSREHDWLDRGPNLSRLGVAAGLIDERTRRALDRRDEVRTRSELEEVREIRADLTGVLVPLAHRDTPSSRSIAALNARLHDVAAYRSVDPLAGRWVWSRPTTLVELLAPVVWDAADVVTDLDRERLGFCASCGWLFFDTTRNRSRRWCDMQDCGSRDKALRYYHRAKHRTADASPSRER